MPVILDSQLGPAAITTNQKVHKEHGEKAEKKVKAESS